MYGKDCVARQEKVSIKAILQSSGHDVKVKGKEKQRRLNALPNGALVSLLVTVIQDPDQ